jgi:VanZ family protein
MSMPKRRALVWTVTAGYWIALVVLTHIPPSRVPATPVSDKLLHFVAYFILTLLLILSLYEARFRIRTAIIAASAIALSYGVVDERVQKLVGRYCSLNDWLADAAGVAAAAVLAIALHRLIASR